MLTEDEKRGLKTPLCRTPVSDLLQFAAQFLPTTLYPSTVSDSLFGMHSLPTLTTSNVSTFPCNDPVHVVDTPSCSASSESAGNQTEGEVTDLEDFVTTGASVSSRPSSVHSRQELSSTSSDTIIANYPPMPAMAQHVSEVQERILRGSSVNEDFRSPIHADTVDAGHASESAAGPETVATEWAESTPEVFPDVTDLQKCLSDVSCPTEKVIETPRSSTHRRSRIVARFGLVQHSESTADSS